jgi:hypothetical protein
MMGFFRKILKGSVIGAIGRAVERRVDQDDLKLMIGRLHSDLVRTRTEYRTLADLEFRVFSQFGDDGIIQYLTGSVEIEHKSFVEFGVGDYYESNTRFLLQNNNWSGFVMDGSPENINSLLSWSDFWKYDLKAKSAFITVENINELIQEGTADWSGIGLLHIDLDGNDYWIWKELNVNPPIVIVEYNSNFGPTLPVTVPYDPAFQRTQAHYSNLYWGASLAALCRLGESKGYQFIGCNSAGNNAYFVRKDKMNKRIRALSPGEGFVQSQYRESRDRKGNLTYLSASDRRALLKGMEVFDVERELTVRLP